MKQRFSNRTRLVSALLTLAMVFTFLPFSAFAAGTEGIPIDETNFPDAEFQKYLRNAERYADSDNTYVKIDTNRDGILSEAERNAVTKIYVPKGYIGQKIKDLTGIQYFPNLKILYCNDNQLSSLDVGQNTQLEVLDCSQNNLSSLDVGRNIQLEVLDCSQNNLSSLDVSQNAKLKVLSCGTNQLSSLDVSQNPELERLYCSENNLTSLDLSQNHDVSFLNAKNNHLTSLNVENTSIDLSDLYSSVEAQDNTYPIAVRSDRTFDLSTLPGAFDVSKASGWVGGTVKDNILTVNENATQVTYDYDCGKGCNATFTLNVNVVPDGSTGGSTPGGPTGGETGGSSGGGGAIIVVAGAAAVGLVGYGVYNYVAERQLQALLPEGAASPENRAQTALLLWNTAGRPEPAAQPAFPDVADPETAKAAQWCVEHGLMNLKFRGRFAPDGSSPAYKTLNAYRQLVG